MTRQMLMENVYLTYIPSEKFKTSFFSAQMAVPLRAETAGLNALMVNVLSRGTARCPDMAAIGRELDMLYGARLEPTVRKKGENQLFGFVASCVDDRFLPAGERLEGTLAVTVLAVIKGCSLIRVHDVKENARAVKMTRALLGLEGE